MPATSFLNIFRRGYRALPYVLLVALLTACGGGSSGPTPPSITAQPQSVSVNDGASATFSVSAGGTSPMSYQWFKDGVAISGGNTSTLLIPAATLQDNTARFHVTLSNVAATVTSQAAVLTVRPNPVVITAQPVSATVNDGGSATFSVSATGSQPISYQWQRNGTVIAGATTPVHAIAAATLEDDASKYSVNISNPAGVLTSAAATLGVAPVPPYFVITPQSVIVKDGAAATFSAKAQGSGGIEWQWYRNGVAIPGAYYPDYKLTTAQMADDGVSFTVVASTKYGSATSAPAVLRVDANAPAFQREPVDVSTTTGSGVSFGVQVTGTAPLSIQWQRSNDGGYIWEDIVGANNTTFTLNNATLQWAKTLVRAMVSNRAASVASRAANLVVLPNVRVVAGGLGGKGYLDGGYPIARLGLIFGLALDRRANIYIADEYGPSVRKYTVGVGNLTTVLPASSLPTRVTGLATDSNNTLFLVIGSAIYKMASDKSLVLVAGGDTTGSADGTGSAARFNTIGGMTFDASDNLYVADFIDCTIRKVTPAGVVTTVAGSAGQCAQVDGVGSAARFARPFSLTFDRQGILYVGDHSAIRSITTDGRVSRYAGRYGESGSNDGQRLTEARFEYLPSITFDDQGHMVVAETWTIRRIAPDGLVSTLAGGNKFGQTSVDGYGSNATMYGATMLLTSTTAPGTMIFADTGNGLVRTVNTNGGVTTLIGRTPDLGSADGTGTAARFMQPNCITTGADGSAYVVDNYHVIRRLWPDGHVTTITPNTGSYSLNCAAADKAGNLYVTDYSSHVIYKVTPSGVTTVLAGVSQSAGSEDGPPGVARLNSPRAIVVDAQDTVWFAEDSTGVLRKLSPNGTVTTVAGKVNQCGNVNGPASSAYFCRIKALAAAPNGSLLIADGAMIRRLGSDGMVTMVAGRENGWGYGDGPVGTFTNITGMAVDAAGYIYVADQQNALIRRVAPTGYTTTVIGRPNAASVVPMVDGLINQPMGVALLPNGRLLITSEYAVIGD